MKNRCIIKFFTCRWTFFIFSFFFIKFISTKPVFLQFFNENSWNPRNFIEFFLYELYYEFYELSGPYPFHTRSNFTCCYYIISFIPSFHYKLPTCDLIRVCASVSWLQLVITAQLHLTIFLGSPSSSYLQRPTHCPKTALSSTLTNGIWCSEHKASMSFT